jgi:uncharacterized protein
MILPDVNVLIYAFRKDAAHHSISKPFVESLVNGNVRFGLSPLAMAAVVRITTNPRSYQQPSALEEVFLYCEYLTNSPNCQIIRPGERHWGIFKRLCIETKTRGPRVTDAWYAALAIEWGCEWITLDRDYARFPGLKWRAPAAPAR